MSARAGPAKMNEHTTAVVIRLFLVMGVLLAAIFVGSKLDVNRKKY
jgi:hypothetical protein